MHRAGIQINCHANGDVAIDRDAYRGRARAEAVSARADARPKITHCTLINDDLVRRIKALDAVPAVFTSYAYYNSDKFHFYGEDFMKRCMAFRTLLDAGIQVAAGSDFSPGPFDPRMGIQGMVTRTGWNGETWGANQRISVDEALRINTTATAPTTRMKKPSRDQSRPGNWPTSWFWPTIFTRWRRTKSRTSRSSARWWAGRRCIRLKFRERE